MNDRPSEPPDAIVEHSTCLACGCLCDDIRVESEGGRVVEAGHACPIGRAWFLAPGPGEGLPVASIGGQAADPAEALDRAAEILRGARAPVIWGLAGSTIEAVRAALAIADRIGAVVDPAGSPSGPARLAAFRRVGLVSATLGEVKDRADVVVFWRVDPLVTHPRHWERYSVGPRGRFIPGGREGRFVVVVGPEPSETSRAADLFVAIDPDREAEAIEVLRALARGVAVDPARAARSAGVPFEGLADLADRLKAARYGALFSGPSTGPRASEPLSRLVRDLNEGRRFVALELGEPGNPAGAAAVLAWQAGAPAAVDFGPGHPRHLPGEATLAARLALGEVDALLIVVGDPQAGRPPGPSDPPSRVPTIRIAPGATDPRLPSSVAFGVARMGLEAGGTVARVDGVMLPLRPAISTALPTDRAILEALLGRLEQPLGERAPQTNTRQLAERLGILGSVKGLPADLSTNPAHREGFGRD